MSYHQVDGSWDSGHASQNDGKNELYRVGHHYVVATSVCDMPFGFEVRHDALHDMHSIWLFWTLEEAIELICQLQVVDRRDEI